jgi:hypothetical protein
MSAAQRRAGARRFPGTIDMTKGPSMTKLIALAAALLAAAPAFAEAVRLDANSEAAIRAKMTADGYEVRRVDTEDGYYEVYAMKDGKKFEVYLDAQLNVVKSTVN